MLWGGFQCPSAYSVVRVDVELFFLSPQCPSTCSVVRVDVVVVVFSVLLPVVRVDVVVFSVFLSVVLFRWMLWFLVSFCL